MQYKGYALRRVDRKISGFTVRVSWDVYHGEVLIKAHFATLEMAKHYIDLARPGCGEVMRE